MIPAAIIEPIPTPSFCATSAGPGAGGEPLKGQDGQVLSMVVYRVPLPDYGSHGGERIKVVGSFQAKILVPEAGFLIKNALDPALVRDYL